MATLDIKKFTNEITEKIQDKLDDLVLLQTGSKQKRKSQESIMSTVMLNQIKVTNNIERVLSKMSTGFGSIAPAGKVRAGEVKDRFFKIFTGTIFESVGKGLNSMFTHYNQEFFGWMKDSYGKTFNLLKSKIEGVFSEILGGIKTKFLDPMWEFTKGTFSFIDKGVMAFNKGRTGEALGIKDSFKKLFLRMDRKESEEKGKKKGLFQTIFMPIIAGLGLVVGYLTTRLMLVPQTINKFINMVTAPFKMFSKIFGGTGTAFRFPTMDKMVKFFSKFETFGKFLTKGMKLASKFLLPLEGAIRIGYQLLAGENWEEKITGMAASLTEMFFGLPAMIVDFLVNSISGLFGTDFKLDLTGFFETENIKKMTHDLGVWLGHKVFDIVESVKGFFTNIPSLIRSTLIGVVDKIIPNSVLGFDISNKKQELINSIKSPSTGISGAMLDNKMKSMALDKARTDQLSGAMNGVKGAVTKLEDKSNNATITTQSNVVAPQTTINNNDRLVAFDTEMDTMNSTL